MTFGSTDPYGGDRRSPQELLASASWRRQNSLWLLVPIFGIGMITWASFLYIGRRAHRRDWLIAGAVYGLAAAIGFYFTDGTEGPDGTENEWLGGYLVALWAAGVVHALLSNRSWLSWRAHNATPWYTQPSVAMPAAPAPAPAPAPANFAPMGVDPSQFYAPHPAPPAARPPMPSVPASPPPGPLPTARPASGPVDVNRADAAQLLALPGMTTERVQHVLTVRAGRRGFGSVEEFADAAGLAPHEHSRLRPLVTCWPAQTASPQPGSGRVVDF